MKTLPTDVLHWLSQQSGKLSSLKAAREDLTSRYQQKQPGQHLQHADAVPAYLLTRLPATYAVLARVLEELNQRLPEFNPQRLWDLGAGPGTATLAALEIWPDLQSELLESQTSMIQSGRDLFAHLGLSEQLTWLNQSLPRLPQNSSPDLITLAYIINELSPELRPSLYQQLQNQQALVLMIEPGTPEGYQHILAARQHFIDAGWQIVGPCPHAQSCPLPEGDWCHFSQRLPRTSLHRQLKSGSQGYEDEKFAWLAVHPTQSGTPFASRILRHPRKNKGNIGLHLCTPDGLSDPILGKSHPQYKALRKAEWGDAL